MPTADFDELYYVDTQAPMGCSIPARIAITRDARQPDLVKIRWLGPAKIVLRKDDDEGKPLVYWISHGT